MKLFHILNEWSNLFIHEKTGGSISRYKCHKNIYLENYFHYQIWYQVKSKLLIFIYRNTVNVIVGFKGLIITAYG